MSEPVAGEGWTDTEEQLAAARRRNTDLEAEVARLLAEKAELVEALAEAAYFLGINPKQGPYLKPGYQRICDALEAAQQRR